MKIKTFPKLVEIIRDKTLQNINNRIPCWGCNKYVIADLFKNIKCLNLIKLKNKQEN